MMNNHIFQTGPMYILHLQAELYILNLDLDAPIIIYYRLYLYNTI